MKKLIFSVALLSAALSASAEDHPLWMRYPAISPDGTTIAFAYKGDLYSVSVNVGCLAGLAVDVILVVNHWDMVCRCDKPCDVVH